MSKDLIVEYPGSNSPLVYGCMNIGGGWNANPVGKAEIKQAHEVIDTALGVGITVFDHADIYAKGKAEIVFGKVLQQRPGLRSRIALQSKCGIRFEDGIAPKRYDLSADWIRHSVENTLRRLGIETLDVLLLHRPDPLMEPDEVANVFEQLQRTGKVKHFGVSNMHSAQMSFLQRAVSQPLLVNQLELSLGRLAWLDEGTTFNVSGEPPVNFVQGTLEYCIANGVQIQAWGSLAQGRFSGKSSHDPSPQVNRTTALTEQLAAEYGVAKEAIILAWLMRHPARIKPVIGTTNPERIMACADAPRIRLSREHWYSLYVSARGSELP